MVSRRGSMILIMAILLAGGCSRAVSPLAGEQEKFFAHVQAPDPAADRALRYAKYYSIAGRHDLAVAELEAALKQDPQNIRLLNALGNISDQLGDYQRAQETYQKILASDPDNALALNNLGYSHYLAGDLRQAEKILQELLTKHPDNTVARNNLGLVWCRQGRQQDAVALWEKKEGPEAAQAKLQQVIAFLRTGKNAVAAGSAAIQVAAAPPPSSHEATAALKEKTAAAEPAARTGAPAGAALPARPLAAPPVARKSSAASGEDNASSAAASGPRGKVEEVAMIIQPASFRPPAAAESPSSVLSAPTGPQNSQTAATVGTVRADALDQLELTAPEEPAPHKSWRRTPRYRMLTIPPMQLPKTVKPLRDYITRADSHQSPQPPAPPELAVY